MKAITNSVLVLIILLIVLLIGIGIFSQVNVIQGYLSSAMTGCGAEGNSCCDNDWCTGDLTCSVGVCISSESMSRGIDESYLVYDTFTPSEGEREAFFTAKSGLGEEYCSNAVSCTGCLKMENIQNANSCTECGDCDSDGTCGSCNGCESAENGAYQGLYDCLTCTGCTGVEYDFSPSCANCESCDGILDTSKVIKSSESSCNQCRWCEDSDASNPVCQSCWECGSSNKWCMQCRRSSSTVCEYQDDYELCDRVKDAMISYGGYPTDVPDYGSLPLPWSSGYDFATTIRYILDRCVNDATVPMSTNENIVQKVCNYDAPGFTSIYYGASSEYTPADNLYDMLTSSSITGENAGILFNDCGVIKVPSGTSGSNLMVSSSPLVFESSTTPRTSSGSVPANVKLVVGNASFNEQSGNGCSYDLYICAQQALATSLEDPILKFYENMTYFDETSTSYTTKIWDPFSIQKGSSTYQVKVTGIRYATIPLSLDGGNYDAAHLSNALIAGLRDYFTVNSYLNKTIDFFCKRTGLYDNIDDCYENEVTVVLNDRMPWKLVHLDYGIDPMSTLPDYKYAYYGSVSSTVEVDLMFFAYSSDIPGINNTIFVSPVFSIKMPPMKYYDSGASGNGTVCISGPSFAKVCSSDAKGVEVSVKRDAQVTINATSAEGWSFSKFDVGGYDGTDLGSYTQSVASFSAASSGYFRATFNKMETDE